VAPPGIQDELVSVQGSKFQVPKFQFPSFSSQVSGSTSFARKGGWLLCFLCAFAGNFPIGPSREPTNLELETRHYSHLRATIGLTLAAKSDGL
jgi:hypothetical protein